MKPHQRHVTPQGKRCPICRRGVTKPDDYIYSFRLQPSGELRLVELCRVCREAGK